MTREVYIEKFLRQLYADFPTDDSAVTPNLVNVWLSEGIAVAAKQNNKDNIAVEGISFVNNGFYTTYKNLAVSVDEQDTWRITLPDMPIGIGSNEDISQLRFKMINEEKRVSFSCIPLTQSQVGFFETMRQIPNKVVYFYEGKYVYAKSRINLSLYTAVVTMISGGDSTNLQSEINVPTSYLPVIDEYIFKQLNIQRNQPVDVQNEGLDAIRTT